MTEPSLGAFTPSFEFILDDISEAADEELWARGPVVRGPILAG